MRLSLPLIALAVLTVACGGDGDESEPSAPSTTAARPAPTPTVPVLGADHPLDPATGARVDHEERVIYLEDCARAEELTAEGGPYGPSPRDAEGNFTPGYAYVCGSQ